MAVFIQEDALSVSANLGKHLLFVWLFVSNIKTATGQINRLDELFSVVRRSSTGHQSVCERDIRVCLALNRNLDNNVPITTHKNIIKSEKAYPLCFAVFSRLLSASKRRFERFISQRLAHVRHCIMLMTRLETTSRI